MTAQGAHKVTAEFEEALCQYTGAPFCVAVDNASNALWLCLVHEIHPGQEILIPSRTYPSVPCEIILAGGRVCFVPSNYNTLTGLYRLAPTRIWDSALRFTHNMYLEGQLMCISFTGAYKHLKLGKGGAILLDDEPTYEWLKRARNSGRGECSYHVDQFTMIGRNCYMMPQIAAQGLLLMNQFYELDGTPKDMADLTLPYPDLSKFPVYTK
jgi:dTDP-4-amino-4,6-dideoxygalactose transaminase